MSDNSQSPDKTGKELAELSARMRQYAEELAKLSSKVGSPGAIPDERPVTPTPAEAAVPPRPVRPPVQTKSLWSAAHAEGDDGDSSLPILASDEALDDESLPVLTAFRQFLEKERRRTRNRMIRLGVLIVAVVAVLLVTAMLWGRHALRRTQQEVAESQVKAEAALKGTDQKMAEYANTTMDLGRRVERERQNLHLVVTTSSNLQQIVRTQRQTIGTMRAEMTMLTSNQSEEITRLKEALSTLEIDNAMLSGTIKELLRKQDNAYPLREAENDLPGDEGPLVEEDESIVVPPPRPPKVLIVPPRGGIPFRLPPP